WSSDIQTYETATGFIPHLLSSSNHLLLHAPPSSEIYTLSLHDALPIYRRERAPPIRRAIRRRVRRPHDVGIRRVDAHIREIVWRSEEHTSELQSLRHLVCRLLLEKKKIIIIYNSVFVR